MSYNLSLDVNWLINFITGFFAIGAVLTSVVIIGGIALGGKVFRAIRALFNG